MSTFEMILNQLLEIAMKDGKISRDEFEIISQVKLDLELFNKALTKADEDMLLEPREIGELHQLKDRILERARIVATIDQEVTDEEAALLKALSQAVKHLI